MLGRLGFTGRVMAILLLALLAFVAASATLGFALNSDRSQVGGWSILPERAVAVVDLLDRSDAPQRALILKIINSENIAVTITKDRPVVNSDASRLAAVEWIMTQFLHRAEGREVIAMVELVPDHSWRDFKFGQLRLFAREPLRIAIGLRDQSWVVFETRVEISSSTIGLPPGFLIGTIGPLVGIAAILAIAREARPLRDLSLSVSRFARDAVPRTIAPQGAADVALLIASVNDMQARIAALLKGRTILLGAISHDLKTYITRLRLRTEAIPDAEQHAKASGDLNDMKILIDDALAIAKGSAVSHRREVVDVAALLATDIDDRAVERISFVAQLPTVRATVHGDAVALRRLFGNLLDNALHHAPRAIVGLQKDNGNVKIVVDDNGPGIPETERVAVFEPFYRLDVSRSRATGGSGLGLAIAKQIVETHGGTIEAGQSGSGGARIVVELPMTLDTSNPRQNRKRHELTAAMGPDTSI